MQFPQAMLKDEARQRLQRVATWFALPVSERQNPRNETLQTLERPPARRPANDDNENERFVKS